MAFERHSTGQHAASIAPCYLKGCLTLTRGVSVTELLVKVFPTQKVKFQLNEGGIVVSSRLVCSKYTTSRLQLHASRSATIDAACTRWIDTHTESAARA